MPIAAGHGAAWNHCGPVLMRRTKPAPQNLFIIFVDAIFTTLFEGPFTKVFDVMARTSAISCLYLARITD
jgi:hypothetical protein